MAGRSKNKNETNKVYPTLSVQQLAYLDQLVDNGNFGNTRTAVAQHLIQIGITLYTDKGYIEPVNKRRS